MANPTATKRKLVLKMSVSLDGFVGGPNGEVDWIFRTTMGDSTAWIVDTLRDAGAHMMGLQARLPHEFPACRISRRGSRFTRQLPFNSIVACPDSGE
jgi:hypothetical protein